MKLSIGERVTFEKLFPKEANFTDAVLVMDIRNKVKIVQDEVAKYEIKSEGNLMSWNDATYAIDVNFTKLEHELLKKSIEKMDRESKIEVSEIFIGLCTKIKDYKAE